MIKITGNAPIEITDTTVVIVSPPGLTGAFTKFANEVFSWCNECGVEADLLGKWYNGEQHLSSWEITDEKQRMLFTLRWS